VTLPFAEASEVISFMNPFQRLEQKGDRMMTVAETAAFLGYSPNYLYELMHTGKIEGWLLLNGSYRFSPSRLRQWCEKRYGQSRKKKKAKS